MKFKKGQSLIEVLVGLSVGAIIIGGVLGLIMVNLRNSLDVRLSQSALSLSQELIELVKSVASSDWNKIHSLNKNSSNQYFMVASGTQFLAVGGNESYSESGAVSGLAAHWKFDEATGNIAYDFSGNNKNGTLTNGPTRIVSSNCKAGQCLNFDGSSQSVAVPVLNSGSVTVSAWFNRTSQDATNADAIFGGWYWDPNTQLRQGFDLRFYINQAQLSWIVETTNGSTVTEKGVSSSNLNTGTWYHAVGTYDSSSGIAKIYINGELVNQSTANDGNTIVPQAQYSDMRLGYSRVNNGYFPGYIDDVRIYNRALSADEIKNLYNSRFFLRYFYVDNISRSLCGTGDITSSATTTCVAGPGTDGVADDPSTQKITVMIKSDNRMLASQFQYITRSWNYSFDQTDWSGGSGQEGPLSKPNSKFYSATSVDSTSTPGAIKVQLP